MLGGVKMENNIIERYRKRGRFILKYVPEKPVIIYLVIVWMFVYIGSYFFSSLDKKGIFFNNVKFLGSFIFFNYINLLLNIIIFVLLIIFILLFFFKIKNTSKYFIYFIIFLVIKLLFFTALSQYGSYFLGKDIATGIPIFNMNDNISEGIFFSFYTYVWIFFIKIISLIIIALAVYKNKGYFNKPNFLIKNKH